MQKILHLISYTIVTVVLTVISSLIAGCTAGDSSKNDAEQQRVAQPTDTLYTGQKAMAVYDYQPERALQIIDSAEVVGNLSQPMADFYRMRIYSQTLEGEVMDSLLGGSRFEATRAIGERLLLNDTVTTDLGMQQNVLEALFYTARQQQDTENGLRWARQLVDVCHRQGAETEALRNEAEIGTILCFIDQKEQGMEKLDSVLALLDGQRRFNELDALIIASKRKMDVLADEGCYLETLPLAQRIIDRLDDYERHPDAYHDDTYREPQDSADRADYIQFYRSQAQGRMTAAYAVLGQQQSMEEVYELIERTVRDATACEHFARYHALEQQAEAARQKTLAERSQLISIIIAITLLAALVALVWYWRQKRIISQKNRVLVRQIEEAMKYKKMYEGNRIVPTPPAKPVPAPAGEAEELFLQISSMIECEQLFLNPNCDRQMLVDRLQISKERIGAAFSRGSSHPSLSAYINDLRLDYAYNLLISQPLLDFEQVALRSGFSSRKYFGDRFKLRYGMTLTEFAASRASLGAGQSQ